MSKIFTIENVTECARKSNEEQRKLFNMKITDFTLTKILKDDETCITGEEFIKRAEKFEDWAGKEDCDWLLEHQDQIPEEWRDYYIVFNWRHPDDSEDVAYVDWGEDSQRWLQGWRGYGFHGGGRVLRRKSATRTLGTSDERTLEFRLQKLEDWKIKKIKM